MASAEGTTPDLFGPASTRPAPASPRPEAADAPLAERLRPASLDEVMGQGHLLGPGRPLRLAFDAGRPHSMILWGPPGVGKTTLARLMARHFDADFLQISAVLAGVKEIREAVERARLNQAAGRRTILFVDEVHRFNKSLKVIIKQHIDKVYCAVFVPRDWLDMLKMCFQRGAQHV